jgi:hypothetical protein
MALHGKAAGRPVELGPAPARSDRLASAVRLMPYGGPLQALDDDLAHRQPRVTGAAPRQWVANYGQPTPALGPPYGASEAVH